MSKSDLQNETEALIQKQLDYLKRTAARNWTGYHLNFLAQVYKAQLKVPVADRVFDFTGLEMTDLDAELEAELSKTL